MKLQLVSHNEDLVEHTFKILNEFNMLQEITWVYN